MDKSSQLFWLFILLWLWSSGVLKWMAGFAAALFLYLHDTIATCRER